MKENLKYKAKFKTGYIRPLRRGVALYQQDESIYLDSIVKKMVGDEMSLSGGCNLTDIKITIEIRKAEKS